ncbi:MAG TPA: CpsD/CapB family tyrosine-protein kinase [Phenylobacterium sp.]|uniref:polysaccharide biosynthesis tyrosine autokinase n=1 Tax=Phenylobacterium sp. TaxID=1871053 RepID=UPI002B469BB0|nr:CpsD/CapB family tyrosine-protein kinase [Phenylobacterium sp.]HKR87359.1 CpsD/CapB family tyrosine-protein kinase [Phenylobacterium sp.]
MSTSRDVERWTGLPYLGAIPRAQARASRLNPSAAVVEYDDPALAASFKNLHATFLRECPGARVVALSSAVPKDGKTTCSVALARTSALRGHRTVLLDFDLRRRSASAELRKPAAVGLLEVMSGRARLDEGLYFDGFTPLYVLPASDDLELVRKAVVKDVFSSPMMTELVTVLRRRFDYIFIDTPPLLAVADTRHIAPHVDAFLFVTRWGRTPKDSVAAAVDLLKSTRTPLAGVVLTQAPPQAPPRAAEKTGVVARGVECDPLSDAHGTLRRRSSLDTADSRRLAGG